VSRNYRFKKIDISNRSDIIETFDDAEVVVNFAAESHVDRSITDPGKFIKSNFFGVYNLLEMARKKDFRFHQVSTDEVYGSLDSMNSPSFTEESAYNPKNPYSATKASADFLVRSYVNTYGVKATISNCGNNFGHHQHPEKLIPKTIIFALNNSKISVYGNGQQIRDWVFVEDHCSAIEAILCRGKVGKTYLVGANNEIRNIDLVKKILGILHKEQNLIEFVKDRPGHDIRYSLSPEKIKQELGWRPKHSFNQALATTVEHYKNNIDVYEEMITMK
jgi:dTDP-glucose 4,6-dehydratase